MTSAPALKSTARPQTNTWWASLRDYGRIARALGHAPRCTSTNLEEQRAGRWAAACRARQIGTMRASLSSAQITALEDLPFWYWTVTREQLWHSNCRALVNFVGRHHRMPADDERRPDEAQIAGWVFTVRAVRRGERRGTLTRERIELLEAIPGWTWTTPEPGAPIDIDDLEVAQLRRAATMRAGEVRALAENAAVRVQVASKRNAAWALRLATYSATASALGHPPAPSNDRRQYEWICRQQRAYARRLPSMTADRVARLEAAPHWIWWTSR